MENNEFQPQINSHRYKNKAFTHTRIKSITQQLREICLSKKTNILEVGIGYGALKHFLAIYPEIKHTSLDFDPNLKPDVVGSVTDMPFEDNSFDLVLCCQVLEHLPFEHFQPALEQLRRVTSDRLILSLPDKRNYNALFIALGDHGQMELDFSRPGRKIKKQNKKFDGQHYWEIGYKNNEYKTILKYIKNTGFKILRNYRPRELPYHHFFILEKISK